MNGRERKSVAGWWQGWPWRLIQTNLRQIDMRDVDADRYVQSLEWFKATHTVTALGSGRECPWSWCGGQLAIRVPELGLFEALKIVRRADRQGLA